MTRRPLFELLEDRTTPAALTNYVNDNWFLVTDNGTPGLSQGDVVDNRLDTGGAATVTGAYGVNAFGTVTQGPGGPISPTSLAAYNNIDDAIAASSAGDNIVVLQGNYNESVTVNKAVNLFGAQASLSAVTRVGGSQPESIITSSNSGGTIVISATGATVAGFDITGNASGAGITTSASVSGFTIDNNIIEQNLIGIDLASSGATTSIISQNVIRNATGGAPTGGYGILADAALSNLYIEGNQLSGNSSDGILLQGASGTAITNVRVVNNKFINNDRLELADVDNSVIAGNTFTAGVSGSSTTAALSVRGGSDNLAIDQNTFTDLRSPAITIDQSNATTPNTNLTIVGNTIHQNVALLPAAGTLSLITISSAGGISTISQNVVIINGALPGGLTAVNGITLSTSGVATVYITGNVILDSVTNSTADTNLVLASTLTASAKVLITANTFSGGANGITITQGASLAQIEIHLNNFLNHTVSGLTFSGSGTINATQNYWDAGSGPTIGSNPGGIGEDIVVTGGGTVTYQTFLATPRFPFAEDFTGPNGSGLPSGMFSVQGSFSIQANALVSGAGTPNIAVTGSQAVDVSVQADVTFTSSSDTYAGLIARYTGPGDTNMYFGALVQRSGQVFAEIWRNLSGSWVRLTSVQVTTTATNALRFDVVGSTLSLYVNGSLATTTTDTSITAAGLTGLRSAANTTFDNFLTLTNPLTSTLLPFAENFNLPNAGSLTNPFTVVFGGLGTTAGQIVPTQNFNLAILSGIAADVSVQATLTVTNDNTFAGLVARYSGPGDSNMYFGTLVRRDGQTFAEIWRSVGGVFTRLTSVNVAVTTATVRFDVIGDNLTLYVNGSVVTSTTDTSLTSGSVGFRTSGSIIIDDFSVNPLLANLAPVSFTETFTSSVSGSISSYFSNTLGTFTQSGGALTATGGLNLAIVNGPVLNDVSVSADFTLNAGFSFTGLVARYSGTGDSSMYYGAIAVRDGNTYADIWRAVNGTFTLLASTQISVSGTVNLRFDVIGSSLKLFVNNTLRVSANDTTLVSGQVGIRSGSNVTIDNFSLNLLVRTFGTIGATETFNSSATNQLSANFTEQVGNFNLQTNAAVGQAGLNLATLNGVTLVNSVQTADVSIGADGTFAGLVARYSGAGDTNMYWGGLVRRGTQTFAEIWRNIGGNWTQLTSAQVNVNSSATLEFDVVGDALRLFVNGNLATFTFDTAITVAGSVGFRTSATASVDNYTVQNA